MRYNPTRPPLRYVRVGFRKNSAPLARSCQDDALRLNYNGGTLFSESNRYAAVHPCFSSPQAAPAVSPVDGAMRLAPATASRSEVLYTTALRW